MTIAEKRALDVQKLMEYDKRNVDEDVKYGTAKNIFNRFYRLVGLRDRNLMDDSNEHFVNTSWHKENEEKEMRWYEKLNKDLFSTYGMNLVYTGAYPHIAFMDKEGIGTVIKHDMFWGHFYN